MDQLVRAAGADAAAAAACGTCLEAAGLPVWLAIPGGVLLAAASKGLVGLVGPHLSAWLSRLLRRGPPEPPVAS